MHNTNELVASPYSEEEAVIAGAINYPHLLPEIRAKLIADDFVCPSMSAIFQVLDQLSSQNSVIDQLTVSHYLGKEHTDALSKVAAMRVSENSANIIEHARLVKDTALKRALWQAIKSVHRQITENPAAGGQDLLASATQELSRVANDHTIKNDETTTYKALQKKTLEKIRSAANNPDGITGIATGFADLDRYLAGLQPADLILLAGRPSMGKTALALNITENALLQGKRGIVFSMEMPSDALLMRSWSSIGRIDHDRLRRGRLNVTEQQNLKRAIEITSRFDIVINDTAALSLPELESIVFQEHQKKPLDFAVIDYIQLMSIIRSGNDTRANGIGDISKGLKQLAKRLGIPIIVLSQLNRSLEQRPNKRPINSDLRDAGGLEQDADVIAFVYRDEVYNEATLDKGMAEIIIGKQRNGPIGTVKLGFEGRYSRFCNPIDNTPCIIDDEDD